MDKSFQHQTTWHGEIAVIYTATALIKKDKYKYLFCTMLLLVAEDDVFLIRRGVHLSVS
jgi:hypothetical protein